MSRVNRIKYTSILSSRWRRVLRITCLLTVSAWEMTAVAQAQTTYSLLSSLTPASTYTDGPNGDELGMKFITTQPGQINAIRFYKVGGENGQHIGRIWALDGSVLLTSVPFSNETTTEGWQEQVLSSPLAINADTKYVVTVNSNHAYGATHGELLNQITQGSISSVADGANGVYGPVSPASPVLPANSYQNSDYYRDVVFQPAGANQVAPPTFSPLGGSYGSAQNVTLSSTTSGAFIHYTTDGSTPSETAGIFYNGPISIGSNTTLRAIAYESGMTDSVVTSSIYSFLPPPTINIESTVTGSLDWTPYSLAQGGLWSGPMIAPYISPLRQLHPKFVRVFLQEYYHLYSGKDSSGNCICNWALMDQFLSEIVKTGAVPIANIDFKPAVLYPPQSNGQPALDTTVVPTSYADWSALVSQLVQHTKDMGFGIQYWEIGNEPEAGEGGGTPYKFTDSSDYVEYYRQTANAIRSVDPTAKVGGPALVALGQGLERGNIGYALIAAASNGEVPLDFFSWHNYGNDPGNDAVTVRGALQEAGLPNTQTFLSEWNMSNGAPNLEPSFQPAFVLENTRLFFDNGLSMAAYYQIHDNRVYLGEFLKFMSTSGADFMAGVWDDGPKYFGLFDFDGNLRPAFHAMRMASAMQGPRLKVSGLNSDIRAYAVQKSPGYLAALLWNFNSQKNKYDFTLNLPPTTSGYFKLTTLNPDSEVNDVQVLRHEPVANLAASPIKEKIYPYQIYWLETNPIDLRSDSPEFSATDSLQFSATVGGTNPAQQTVTIGYNGADPGLAFSATVDMPPETGARGDHPIPWITVTTLSGAGDGQTIGTSVNVTGLAVGLYMGTVSVSRGDLPATTYRVTLTVNPVNDGSTLFTTQIPNYPDQTDNNQSYELGVKFQTKKTGQITAIRYYRAPDDLDSHTGTIWDSSGNKLRSVPFINETPYGWQTAILTTPIRVWPNTTYVVSVNANKYYVSTPHGLDSVVPDSKAQLQTIADNANGVLDTLPGQFPASSSRNSNYFRDVVFQADEP